MRCGLTSPTAAAPIFRLKQPVSILATDNLLHRAASARLRNVPTHSHLGKANLLEGRVASSCRCERNGAKKLHLWISQNANSCNEFLEQLWHFKKSKYVIFWHHFFHSDSWKLPYLLTNWHGPCESVWVQYASDSAIAALRSKLSAVRICTGCFERESGATAVREVSKKNVTR